MKRLEKEFVEHLSDASFAEFDFEEIREKIDYHSYKSQKKSEWFKKTLAIGGCMLIVCLIAFPLLTFLEIENSFKMSKRNYSIHELNLIESSSFKKLNEVTYPTSTQTHLSIDDEYRQSILDFSALLYNNIDKEDNIILSPLSLYMNLNLIALSSTDTSIQEKLRNILQIRADDLTNYRNMYENNYFSNESGTLQMYQAVFLSDDWMVNPDYPALLSKYYAEVYQLDFSSEEDIRKMLSWSDQKMGMQQYLTKDDLELSSISALYFMSALYFKQTWYNTFLTDDNTEELFYQSGENVYTTFMNHTYYGSYYDYGDYISFSDHYRNQFRIQYLIPKKIDDDIFALTDGKNIFSEDESKRISDKIIRLSVPKFETTYTSDLKETLIAMGLYSLFDEQVNALDVPFTNTSDTFYLSWMKQKNQIVFEEDGTTARSVSFSSGAKAAAPIEEENTIEIKLNQPFIYIIYDTNQLPLFVGTLTRCN